MSLTEEWRPWTLDGKACNAAQAALGCPFPPPPSTPRLTLASMPIGHHGRLRLRLRVQLSLSHDPRLGTHGAWQRQCCPCRHMPQFPRPPDVVCLCPPLFLSPRFRNSSRPPRPPSSPRSWRARTTRRTTPRRASKQALAPLVSSRVPVCFPRTIFPNSPGLLPLRVVSPLCIRLF